MIRHAGHVLLFNNRCRCTMLRTSSHLRYASSSDPSSASCGVLGENVGGNEKTTQHGNFTDIQPPVKRHNSMVEAAFASLKAVKNASSLEQNLISMTSVEEVLSATQSPKLTRYDALRVVSILADWAAKKKVRLKDFENDPRFVRVCRLLGQSPASKQNSSGLGDLATVLAVAGDDEAAKLVGNISLPQVIKIFSALAYKKRRSTPLLRSLSANISNSWEKLDLKQAADILYSMAVLNFPDNMLLEKTSSDICACLESNRKPAVVGSILTSLGLLRYKNTVLLNMLAEWIERHCTVCRTQDLVALLLTLATVNHHPENSSTLYNVLISNLNSRDVSKPSIWLDVVWALVVLNQAHSHHLESVLVNDFVTKLDELKRESGPSTALHTKLLNINAAAQILGGYAGPRLSDVQKFTISPQRSKEKQKLVESVVHSLTNLFPSAAYLRTDINSNFGFQIDGECVVDSKCNPLPVEATATQCAPEDHVRVAVMVFDYHDMCHGRVELTGPASLYIRILEHQGYRVLVVPYTEFNPQEKLVVRVKYLEQQLRAIARKSSV